MNTVRASQPRLADITPYDPKYLPAKEYLSANENPRNVPEEIQLEIRKALKNYPFNRYPDPLANELRDLIAEKQMGFLSLRIFFWEMVVMNCSLILCIFFFCMGRSGRTFSNL